MGKRSRKREGPGARRAPADAPVAAPAPPRAASRRARLDELPKPPWAPFPLVELCVLLGLILIGIGLFAGGDRSAELLFAGVGLAAVAGLEQAIREHFAGFRSHTTLLAGVVAVLVMVVATAAGLDRVVALAVALIVLASAWPLLRNTFTRRSGGFSFRV